MNNQKNTKFSLTLTMIIGLILIGLTVKFGQNAFAAEAIPTGSQAVPVTIITVDSGKDLDTSKSTTCENPANPCTLRRAIVQARALGAAQRPVLIQFDIPTTADEGYDSVLGIWKIHALSTTDPSVFRTLEYGQIIIDGSTQSGGTTTGPKIFIVGPSTGAKDGLIVGTNNSGSHDSNEIRGLAFQNFKTHLIVNSNNNLVEDNWFGLEDDGTEPYLRNDDLQDGSGSGGVALSAGVTGNLIQNNVFLGFDGVAAAIRGDANTFADNYVGTAYDGTTPGKLTNPSLVCTTVDWLGGGGISMEGDDHVIENNTFAALRQEIFSSSTQPDAIRVTGTGHLIQNNTIGVESSMSEVGVCGRGVYLSDSPKEVQVLNNTIVEPGLSAISLNGVLYDENTLRTNVIKKSSAWPEVEGNPEPEDAIQVGPSMTDAFRNFLPAKVTEINGTSISGTSGEGSPCPNCIVEIFLDDTDNIIETLQSLAIVTAGANGNWSATLPFELSNGQGLRTTSTTAQYNTIPGMSAGTTTQLSELYVSGGSDGSNTIYIPFVIK
jgi:hypothetical protein